MKKFLILVLIQIFSVPIFSEKFFAGESFEPYTPLGLNIVVPKSISGIVYPTVAAIRPYGNNGKYELVITMINSDGNYADWIFPVNVTYIVEKGTKIFVNKNYGFEKNRYTLIVENVSDNEIEFTTISELLRDDE